MFLADASEARIAVKSDKRFQPVCYFCDQKDSAVHSWSQRSVRDLNLASAKVWINCQYRKRFCPHCQHISIEDLQLFDPYLRGHPAPGALHLSVVRVYDRHRGGQASWPGLEDGQKHRQMVLRGPIRSTQFRGAAYFGCGRNLHQKGPALPDRGYGLSQRPGGICWQRPQSQHLKGVFEPIDHLSEKIH